MAAMRTKETDLVTQSTGGNPELVHFFKALADPTRQELLCSVEEGERSLADLSKLMKLSVPTVSRHLSVLENARLVEERRVGQVRWYRLDRPAFAHAIELFLTQFHFLPVAGVDKLIDLAADLAARHPDLQGKRSIVRSLIAWESSKPELIEKIAGEPRRLVTAADLQEDLQVRIAGEAIADVWQEEMLESREVALALGAKETNREKVRQLRNRSWLLGLPHKNAYLYPAFQLDVARRRVHPEVRRVNVALDAASDPWGVASWWISRHDGLAARPMDLVGSARAEDLAQVAKAATAPVG